MKDKEIAEEVEFPQGVQAQATGRSIKIKGPKGELERSFNFPKMELKVEGDTVNIIFKHATKREKTQLGTAEAHIANMIRGVTEGHVYKLKICSGHFPMNVTLSGDVFSVKNFLGEKVPRTLKIKKGAKVTIDGTEVTVEGIDIETVGQVAADIEQLTRITNRDIRIFQDGIYIVKKSRRELT